MKRGVAFVSEERKSDGFIPMLTGRDNVVLPVLDRFRRLLVLHWPALHESADRTLAQVSVRGDVHAPLSKLSGGNQQKVLFAKAILQAPRVLLLDEPTKGVDIGAKAEIHQLIGDLAHEKGAAVVMVSTEEEELLSVADRIVVFRAGECDGHAYDAAALTPARLRELAWSEAGALRTAS
jgi:ribose transport system ATP-binding protein